MSASWPDPLVFSRRVRDWRWLWFRYRTEKWIVPEREAVAFQEFAENLATSEYRISMDEAISRLRAASGEKP